MKKKLFAFGLMAVLLTGCSQNVPAPQNTQTPPPRKDIVGNIIEESYKKGVVSSITDTEITVSDGGDHTTFALSENTKADIAVLHIATGTKVIVNFKEVDGVKNAVSIEKIVG